MKLNPLLCVRHAAFISSLRNSQGLRGNTYSASIQRRHGNTEAFPFFSEQILLRNFNILEDQLGGGGGTNSHLVIVITKGKSFPSFFYDKRADTPGSDSRRRDRKNHIGVGLASICNKNFLSIQNIKVSVQNRGSLCPSGIRTCVRFRKAKGAKLLSFCQRNQILHLLFLCSKGINRPAPQRDMGGKDNTCSGIHPCKLFHCNGIGQNVFFCPSVFLWIRKSHPAVTRHFFDHISGKMIFPVPLERIGLDLRFRKCPDFFAEFFMFLRTFELHSSPPFLIHCPFVVIL